MYLESFIRLKNKYLVYRLVELSLIIHQNPIAADHHSDRCNA